MVSVIVGVAGGTGSGKTTLVENLVARLGTERALVVPHDAYYRDRPDLDAEARAALNFDHPDAIETALCVAHVRALAAGGAVEAPVYDFSEHRRTSETRPLAPRSVVLVDGILALAEPVLRETYDLAVFVDTPADVRVLRRLERDVTERGRTVNSVVAQYFATVRPMHDQFVEPSRVHADVVVAEGGKNAVALAEILARIEVLASR